MSNNGQHNGQEQNANFGHDPHDVPPVYDWQQLVDSGSNPELVPGAVIENIPDLMSFEVVAGRLERALKISADPRLVASQWESPVRHVVPQFKLPRTFHGKLEGFRVVILETSPEDLARMNLRHPGLPAVTAAYTADMKSTGLGKVDVASMIITTAVDVPTPLDAQRGKVYCMRSSTRSMESRGWSTLLETSKALGHIALATGIQRAFPAGIPGTGKKR